MRHKAVLKEEIRQGMVDAAARAFRRSGYAGVGVDGIAAEAGVTSGAIYSQFGSKEGAFMAAMAGGLDVFIKAVPQFQKEHGTGWLKAFADFYLGPDHVGDIAGGCTIATLVPDVVRANSPAVREQFTNKTQLIVDLMAAGLAGPPETRHDRAWATLAAFIGGLNLVRAMPTKRDATIVAESIKASALSIAGPVGKGPPAGRKRPHLSAAP